MKKNYQKPTSKIFEFEAEVEIMNGSDPDKTTLDPNSNEAPGAASYYRSDLWD